jgi:hyaluronoglucosaminidase
MTVNSNLYLGTIEGFFGSPWTWQERKEHIKFLKSSGFNFYMYAPKADPYLRKKWHEDFPASHLAQLHELRQICKEEGVKFGIGFTPFEIFHNFDSTAKESLTRKIKSIDKLSPDNLGILFDDMDGNIEGLAMLQSDIMNFICSKTNTQKISFCPTYYSEDKILDKVFGQRPCNYLEDLGNLLDSKIDIMWTGPKVISNEITEMHLKHVSEKIGRKPLIWDNYPVNDGPKNCKFIFIDAIKNREKGILNQISGYMANPMNQPYLSQIPLLTIAELFSKKNYTPEVAIENALEKLSSLPLLPHIQNFESIGLDNFLDDQVEELRSLLKDLPPHIGREIEKWLDGFYNVGKECLTQ